MANPGFSVWGYDKYFYQLGDSELINYFFFNMSLFFSIKSFIFLYLKDFHRKLLYLYIRNNLFKLLRSAFFLMTKLLLAYLRKVSRIIKKNKQILALEIQNVKYEIH